MLKHFMAFTAVLASIALSANGQTSLTGEIDKLLIPYFKNNEPGGVVLVAKNGKVLYKKAFGMANMELDVPVNDSMIFYIGSNTKQFTAVAILQLMESGKLQLQDSIGKYIPGCNYPAGAITLQQLLSHTSGIGSKEPDTRKPKNGKAAELAAYVINLPMDFGAGTQWAYNNSNFYILGCLIEILSGKSYADYITDNIFKPAGMLNTYMEKELPIIKNRPPGYTIRKTGIENVNSFTIGTTAYAAGGIQSTAEDMLKWNRALISGKLLKPATLQLAFTRQLLSNGKPVSYGFGWRLGELHGSPTIHHGGLVRGYASETLYLPQEDVYLVMLLNSEAAKIPLVVLSRIIGGLAIGKPYNFTETAIDKNMLKQLAGLYENDHQEQVNITEENGRLYFQRPGGHLYVMHHAGNNDFFLDKDFIRVQFTTDATGNIKSLQLSVLDSMTTEWFKTEKPILKLSPEGAAIP